MEDGTDHSLVLNTPTELTECSHAMFECRQLSVMLCMGLLRCLLSEHLAKDAAKCADSAADDVFLSTPLDGSIFRPGETVQFTFKRRSLMFQLPSHRLSWRPLSVAVELNGETLGEFHFPDGNRTINLVLDAVPEGRHVVRADVEGHVFAEVTLHVKSGALDLHAGELWRTGVAGGALLDHWGCLLLGASVSSLPGISKERPLHLWLNGERLRTDEGWLVARVPPGMLHVRAAVTDAWGDVVLENHTTLHVLLPPRALMGDARAQAIMQPLLAQRLAFHHAHSRASPQPTRGANRGGGARRQSAAISCLHPTRGRAGEALATRARWLAAASSPHLLEWVFAVDSDDAETYSALVEALREEAAVAVVRVQVGLAYHAEGTCVAAWNAAALAARGRVLMAVADHLSAYFALPVQKNKY